MKLRTDTGEVGWGTSELIIITVKYYACPGNGALFLGRSPPQPTLGPSDVASLSGTGTTKLCRRPPTVHLYEYFVSQRNPVCIDHLAMIQYCYYKWIRIAFD